MRKFIISDIHGVGNVYYAIMGYLDNLSKEEEIELYINGDLIDRGPDSANVLLDIKKRVEGKKYKIVYLGGNHELMMYRVFEARKKSAYSIELYDWYENGGRITDNSLEKILNKEEILDVASFIGNLKIYHKFNEKINGKNIVLVHAACPLKVKDECDWHINDDYEKIFYYVWAREENPYMPFRCKIGNEDYFTIVGHTPNDNKYGYEYHKNQNYLNIDSGCAVYAQGIYDYNHVPLVEIKDDYLEILTFDNYNEIICGNYFNGTKSIPMSSNELKCAKRYIKEKK